MSEEEFLSQNQVENLLKQMEANSEEDSDAEESGLREPENAPSAAGERSGASGPRAPHPMPRGPRTTHYDFKRPERVGKDQMRAMHALHEGLARGFGAAVSGMLSTMLEVKLISVDQLTYSEFVFSLDNPSCFNVLRPSPLDGHWILDIAPSLCYAVIDRMLGGDATSGEPIRRALTEIEHRLIGRMVKLFTDELKKVWYNIIELDLVVERVESNLQLVQIVPPNEVVILVGLEVALGKNRGMINLCIPFNTIERFNSQLSNNGWVGYTRSASSPEKRTQVTKQIDDAPVELVVTLAETRVRTADLFGLSVGDIIATEKDVSEPLKISVQSVPKFTASAGAFRGKKAVRIKAHLERDD